MTPHILTPKVGTALQWLGPPPSFFTNSLNPIIKEIGAVPKARMETEKKVK